MSYSDKFLDELALRWAPVNYQYINLGGKDDHYYTKQDLILPVNFEYYKVDGVDPEVSYDTQKVIDRLESLKINQLTPVGYYSVAITKNHFYVLYSFYHADDTSHPNDMERCLIILERFGDKEEGWTTSKGFAIIDEFEFVCNGYTPNNPLYNLMKTNGYKVSSQFSLDLDNNVPTCEDHPKFKNLPFGN